MWFIDVLVTAARVAAVAAGIWAVLNDDE